MDLLTPILTFLQTLDPTTAAIATVLLFILQRVQSGKGVGLSAILDSLKNLFAKPATPAAPDKEGEPTLPPADDSDRLLDILMRRLRDRFKVKAGKDEQRALAFYSRFVSALDQVEKPAVKDEPKVS